MTVGTWILSARERTESEAFQYKLNGQWIGVTWPEYCQKVVSVAMSLKQNGLNPRDHVGLMCSTRWEWSVLDMAILGSNAITVPMYPNLSDDDFVYIVDHSEIKILIIEDDALLEQVERTKSRFARPVFVYVIEKINFSMDVKEPDQDAFYIGCKNLKSEDIATIIYTSGTTGQPKGVVLLHEAIASEVIDGFELFNVKKTDRALTFLPFAHVLGRLEHWGSCYNGHCLAYAESVEKIRSNLKEVKPDFMIAVPRIFEKVYAGILAQIETQKFKQTMFQQALEAAVEIEKYRKTKSAIPWGLLLKYEALNKLALQPIRDAFGGKLRFAVSGGAPLDSQLTSFFTNCGVPVLEGYGLSETTGAITVNALGDSLPGTVGKPIGDVQIKIAADGEILVKSKKCLKEYYKNTEETARSIQDGYFATGDIGELTDSGFLRITDRKKDLIKTAGGKYVAPQKLEGLLKMEPLISNVLIHGDQKKYIVALISCDEDQLKKWASNNGISFESFEEIYSNQLFKARIQKHIQSVNSHLASFESIKKYEILRDQWTVENGSLTQSLKVKRKQLEKQYLGLIETIYD